MQLESFVVKVKVVTIFTHDERRPVCLGLFAGTRADVLCRQHSLEGDGAVGW